MMHSGIVSLRLLPVPLSNIYSLLCPEGGPRVTAVAYADFHRDLESYLRRVNDDADVLLVTNRDPHDNVVVMGADDYDSLMEALRICRNPGLFDKVRRGMAQVRSGVAAAYDWSGE